MLLTPEVKAGSGQERKSKIQFKVLGMVQKQPVIMGKQPIVKIVTVQGMTSAKDATSQNQERIFIVSLVLRENGHVEVYSDFELAEEFDFKLEKEEDKSSEESEKQDTHHRIQQPMCLDI